MARAAALALCGLVLCAVARAQMESPLKGVGFPRLETDQVFVSVYLDRLLAVDEDNYRWEAVLYFYISWSDTNAFQTVSKNTAQMLGNSSYTCPYYCSNVIEKMFCCDDIYLPSMFFKNAYGFPQDRAIAYNIYPAEDGSMLWEVRVHAIFYQPMDFSHYPFDSFDLLLELRFMDPTVVYDTTPLWGAPHPGVELLPSSGGSKLFTYGKGDETSSWAVTDFQMEQYSVDMGMWFDEFSELTSHPEDPMPLAPVNSNQTGGYVDSSGKPLNIFTGVQDQLLAVLITIDRFWKPSLINSVLPVVLVFLLGMLVFFVEESDLTTRLEIVVTLFLALTAVQFVLVGSIPTSSYVVPTQQLVLLTYCLLFLLATESIVVYHIVSWTRHRERSQRRREAYRKYRQLRARGKLAGGQNPPLSAADCMTPEPSRGDDYTVDGGSGDEAHAAAKAADLTLEAAAAEAAEAGAVAGATKRRRRPFGLCFGKPANEGRGGPTRVTSFSHMTADEAYGDYVGHLLDNTFGVCIGFAYTITTILIFTLQHGYIDLFAD